MPVSSPRGDAEDVLLLPFEALIADLFEAFFSDPSKMPDEWGENLDPADAFRTARRVADYIAGMTDRYAVSEHQRLFDDTPDLG